MSTPTRETIRAVGPAGDAPFRFLVSTTGAVADLAKNLGNADYSYGFVLKAIGPALEGVGPWRLVDRPESRLSYLAREARQAGERPVHLCVQPPQNGYLTPDVPTAFFPFWEFPDVPARDFAYDTRQNWVQILNRSDLVLAACRFTADAFRRAGVTAPVAVVPVPVPESALDVPAWDPHHVERIVCRHVELRPPSMVGVAASSASVARPPLANRAMKRVYTTMRGVYNERVVRWLSPEAVELLFQKKNAILGKAGKRTLDLAPEPLELGGLVFTSLFNLGDRRKNIDNMLTGFLLAFRDRPDATLVLKLATNPDRAYHEMRELRWHYERLRIDHACRVVVILDYLTDEQLAGLYRASTYYLNTSRAEGSCLPLQEALAAGRPAVAPRHTSLADYIDDRVAFVIDSDEEPTFFPHDPEPRYETSWHRLNWASLRDRLREAARVAEREPGRYHAMAGAAGARMKARYSTEACRAALAGAFALIDEQKHERRFSWAA